MEQITLFVLDVAAAEYFAADPEGFAERHRLALGPHQPVVTDIARQTALFLASSGIAAPWSAYLALEGTERRVVGTCGFKGAPDASGAVEIAYFTFPGEEGKGVATAMAAALVRVAGGPGTPVIVVRAHTLRERNASCRVLEKAGFRFTGEVIEPEDGLVWRWESPVRAEGDAR